MKPQMVPLVALSPATSAGTIGLYSEMEASEERSEIFSHRRLVFEEWLHLSRWSPCLVLEELGCS